MDVNKHMKNLHIELEKTKVELNHIKHEHKKLLGQHSEMKKAINVALKFIQGVRHTAKEAEFDFELEFDRDNRNLAYGFLQDMWSIESEASCAIKRLEPFKE